jgi:homoserine dehydrogenase
MNFRLVLLGFGNVAQGLAKILVEKRAQLRRDFGFEYEIVGVADIVKGSVMNRGGLDLGRLLALARESRGLGGYPGVTKGLSSIETIKESDADVLVEATWTNLKDGEPGLTHIRTALNEGLHVVTTNKAPIALAYHELAALARQRRRHLRFEGTVLSGTPAINLATEALAGATVTSIRGILNGTTNYILGEMEDGRTFCEALKRAQELGYAEAEPSGDVEAWDSAAKITILANVLMGGTVRLAEVRREGISRITAGDVREARLTGRRIKLVAKACGEKGQVKAQVVPERLPETDLLSHVSGVLNALVLSTDVQPDITIIGPGAGGGSAGYALLSDLLALNRALSNE